MVEVRFGVTQDIITYHEANNLCGKVFELKTFELKLGLGDFTRIFFQIYTLFRVGAHLSDLHSVKSGRTFLSISLLLPFFLSLSFYLSFSLAYLMDVFVNHTNAYKSF